MRFGDVVRIGARQKLVYVDRADHPIHGPMSCSLHTRTSPTRCLNPRVYPEAHVHNVYVTSGLSLISSQTLIFASMKQACLWMAYVIKLSTLCDAALGEGDEQRCNEIL